MSTFTHRSKTNLNLSFLIEAAISNVLTQYFCMIFIHVSLTAIIQGPYLPLASELLPPVTRCSREKLTWCTKPAKTHEYSTRKTDVRLSIGGPAARRRVLNKGVFGLVLQRTATAGSAGEAVLTRHRV